ncbi:hypothetical protein BCR34DRAFT_29161 [Clohesyomyces aquaticus]|uniref:Uncharacterized protein n=1 Tax=Clohesyomyces aquaticus TaxID=1231657 RepID=A0A1Y1ZA80_9PLEO|nr:hypothetical protein BCR34DRAFT_29161 [Clohesyomyces aquaticus]
MDRDRERDRDRDRRDDRYSNTYRPRSPPGRGIDSYRSRGPLAADTYTPGSRASRPRSPSPTYRRRSRSPRRDDDRWRARPRSPPRRAYSPRRDDYRGDRGRSPRRPAYDSYTTRSPRVRDRSPPPRERDISPARSRGMRSPPRKRDPSPPRSSRYEEPRSRAHSPYRRNYSPPPRDTREFRRRSPSPRRDRVEPFAADTWRRRSPSPVRQAYAPNDASGRNSAATSRRSSPPPVHPSRAVLVTDDRPARDPVSAPRSPYREREREDGEREFPRERERERELERERSPPPPRRDAAPPTGPRGDREREFAPPTGPSASYRNGDTTFVRAPPTGPSARSYPSPAISPPIGPSNSTPQPPAFPRGNNPVLAAPTRPRGGGRGGFGYDAPRDFSGPPPSRRGSAHWGARGGGNFYGGAPPSGPRGAAGSGPGPFAPPFRGSSNSTSTTYPRTQRFNAHMNELAKEIPGGQKAPEVYDQARILQLEEESRRLREKIEAKEMAKRQHLREWDTLEKDAANTALRSELAEQQLRSLNGESEVGGAAF